MHGRERHAHKVSTINEDLAALLIEINRRIQEEGLRTYLFTYAPHYSTLSLSLLSRTFSIPVRAVTSIVSKMIWNEELSASLDQSAGVVVFHRVDLTRSQQLAQTLADKVSAMVEQNEKALDQKLGNTTNWGDRGDGQKGDKRGEQTLERRRGGERRGGVRGKSCPLSICHPHSNVIARRCSRRARGPICSGIGKPDGGDAKNSLNVTLSYLRMAMHAVHSTRLRYVMMPCRTDVLCSLSCISTLVRRSHVESSLFWPESLSSSSL